MMLEELSINYGFFSLSTSLALTYKDTGVYGLHVPSRFGLQRCHHGRQFHRPYTSSLPDPSVFCAHRQGRRPGL